MIKEEKNVFRDAKFGDKFLTRNGQVMIYQKQAREDAYCLFDEVSDCIIEYRPNGDVIYEYTGNAEPQEDDIVKKYVQSSLQSNLDEAAEEYEMSIGSQDYCYLDIADAFKAGAEWMAGQGETFNGFMSVKGKRSLISIEGSSQNLKFGENVIVQIRKKEE